MKKSLKELILSEENIYNAIYAVHSYILEPKLLNSDDINLLRRLHDKYDFKNDIQTLLSECKGKLKTILESKSELFEINVFFKLKKLDGEIGQKKDEDKTRVIYRPLHSASLKDQICMAAMLLPLMFDDTSGKRRLSELSRMLPHNFYGNIPNTSVENIFMNWTDKYREYSNTVNNRSREYKKTKEYNKEICFDLKDFFPSIDPQMIFNFIWNKVNSQYAGDDEQTLKTILTKLLYFKIPEDNLMGWTKDYFGNVEISPVDGFYPAKGIAQGLPQSYFFGNLCMIDVAQEIENSKDLDQTDSYFYVDDSVVFARNIDNSNFVKIIANLNKNLEQVTSKYNYTEIALNNDYLTCAKQIKYKIQFHDERKSSICDIEDSMSGLADLFGVQRTVSNGGWIKGNIDEIDDNVAQKKLQALKNLVEKEIKKTVSEQNTRKNPDWGKIRLKWLRRYKRYFLFRLKKIQLLLNGEFDRKIYDEFLQRFRITEIIDEKSNMFDHIQIIFELFEEDIFKSEFELLLTHMPSEMKSDFCKKIKQFDERISVFHSDDKRNEKYLYYCRIAEGLLESNFITINQYAALSQLVRSSNHVGNSETLVKVLQNRKNSWQYIKFSDDSESTTETDANVTSFPAIQLPAYCRFIFNNSDNFKRKILNCLLSIACNVTPEDTFSILRNDIKPIRYYELRIFAMLRNRRCNIQVLMDLIQKLDIADVTERMEIDLDILKGLGIFEQRVHDPSLIDKLILTHRLVKSLWHNGSKFLNAYTLHNQEHAINLIKNTVRLINNIDFLNLKARDYFLLFNACYLHDISMVIHPNIALLNDSNTKSEQLISKWVGKLLESNDNLEKYFKLGNPAATDILKIRKNVGLDLVEAFKNVFDYFEDKVRGPHAHESALCIKQWQSGMLSYLSELDAEIIALVSESHGWDPTNVYGIKSSAKEDLVSIKYMMILIRVADLLDLANDRIDYFLLKQNRSQMNMVSRYHWISHLITDGYAIDVDYELKENHVLEGRPISERINIDIFLNTEIVAAFHVNSKPCKGIKGYLTAESQKRYPQNLPKHKCLKYEFINDDTSCNGSNLQHTQDTNERDCPFLCAWMSNKHAWLFSELKKLKKYLEAVNSSLVESDIAVRFFYSNYRTLDPEFYDDVKSELQK